MQNHLVSCAYLLSCVQLCDLMDHSLSGSSVHGIYFIHFFPFTNSYSLMNYCEPALVLGSRERSERDMVPAHRQLTTTCEGN